MTTVSIIVGTAVRMYIIISARIRTLRQKVLPATTTQSSIILSTTREDLRLGCKRACSSARTLSRCPEPGTLN